MFWAVLSSVPCQGHRVEVFGMGIGDRGGEVGSLISPLKGQVVSVTWLFSMKCWRIELFSVKNWKDTKGKGEKERYSHLNAEFKRLASRDKKAFLSDQCKEVEETIEWERLEISSRKLEISREHFVLEWAW